MSIKTRRDFLQRAGMGFGAAAACSLLSAAETTHPLARKAPHAPPRAKRVIYLFMHGGVSHVDTWDPKPELARLSGQTLPTDFVKGLKTSRIDFSKALVRGGAFDFAPRGQSGTEVSDLFPHMGKHVDDYVVVRSCHGDAFDHAPAMYLSTTGSQFPGKPCLGAWTVYGLGTENQDLPAFVVMSDGAMKSGPQAYGAGYLPAVYQGTVFRSGKYPVLDLAAPAGIGDQTQRTTLDFIQQMDKRHLANRPYDSDLEARLASYELAYRMQSAAPEAANIDAESEATKKMYGIGETPTDDFGRKCLLARRLAERGVRLIQLYAGSHLGDDWDGAHNDLIGSHKKMAAKTDKPIGALLADLKGRGMLDDTLVVWASEFGRTPLAEGKNGRDHHPYAFSMWMAGAGIKGGRVLGSTDEFGLRPVERPITAHDINATILRLLGVDHTRLTYFYQGRDQRLTDVHGEGEFTKFLLG
ncbi:MAG TPA: DUF1501 domain-containing protein [Bryobacteraceae bacterium]|nr:DUF1501 domain-containing protein [Bryobacteraceae bacterium]